MDYTQLKSLAESRGCLPEEPHNREEIRKAIHDWEMDRGLPFKGLREIATKNTETTDLSSIEKHLIDLTETLSEILQRVSHIEAIVEDRAKEEPLERRNNRHV